MDYYKRFMGDYQRDTGDLSLAQHGAYTVLLDHYYSVRKPLPASMEKLHRLCRATTKAEQDAVESVVEEFFPIASDGLRHNYRADQELDKWEEMAESNREKGKLGGRPKRKAEGNPPGNPDGNPPGNHPGSSRDTKSPINGSPGETRTVPMAKPGNNPLQIQNPNPDPEATHRGESGGERCVEVDREQPHERWRDVGACDPVAYTTWLEWRASENDTVPDRVRIQDAKFLGGKGSPAQQREFIDKLIRLRFKRLHDPIEHRQHGTAPGGNPKPTAEHESLKLRELKDGRQARGLADFRDPYPVETADTYATALRTEENRRGSKLGAPRFPMQRKEGQQ
jgi:uncharacterized protein YdaU (DUF1376 family)